MQRIYNLLKELFPFCEVITYQNTLQLNLVEKDRKVEKDTKTVSLKCNDYLLHLYNVNCYNIRSYNLKILDKAFKAQYQNTFQK